MVKLLYHHLKVLIPKQHHKLKNLFYFDVSYVYLVQHLVMNDDVNSVDLFLLIFYFVNMLVLFHVLFHYPFHFDKNYLLVCDDVLYDSFLKHFFGLALVMYQLIVHNLLYYLYLYDCALDNVYWHDFLVIVLNVVWHVIMFVYPRDHFVIQQNYFLKLNLFEHLHVFVRCLHL